MKHSNGVLRGPGLAFGLAAAAILASACTGKDRGATSPSKGGQAMDIEVTSTAFEEGGMIPPKYTADGDNVSPPLAWSGVPAGTESLVVISDDPDAPAGTWVHWVLYDLPANTRELPEEVPPGETLPNDARHGRNDFRKFGYGGPAPPSGTHRYFFKVYALDTKLGLAPGATKAELLQAMEGHILAQGQLMGKYTREG